MGDHPEAGSELELTDDAKAELEKQFEDIEQSIKTDGGGTALRLIDKIAGSKLRLAAVKYVQGLRIARMRQAAEAKGLRIGV